MLTDLEVGLAHADAQLLRDTTQYQPWRPSGVAPGGRLQSLKGEGPIQHRHLDRAGPRLQAAVHHQQIAVLDAHIDGVIGGAGKACGHSAAG
jgi:hypothetical protein